VNDPAQAVGQPAGAVNVEGFGETAAIDNFKAIPFLAVVRNGAWPGNGDRP